MNALLDAEADRLCNTQRVVGGFPGGQSALNLAAARLVAHKWFGHVISTPRSRYG